MSGGRPLGGNKRAGQYVKAGKLGGRPNRDAERARDAGAAERALVLKDYATRARQQTGAELTNTVHCALLDYFSVIALQVYF